MLMQFIEITTVLIVLATAMISLRLRQKAQAIHDKAQEIHVLVNDRMTEALTRIDQLAEALLEAGVEIPIPPTRNGGEGDGGDTYA